MSKEQLAENFWHKPLGELNSAEWEALCDGCGKCCLHKLQDADTDEIFNTNIACKLLDLKSCQCSDYKKRRFYVPDCIRLTRRNLEAFTWLPHTCAYRLRSENKPLESWHYLISGTRDSVHDAGMSVRGKAISETLAGPIEEHVIDGPI